MFLNGMTAIRLNTCITALILGSCAAVYPQSPVRVAAEGSGLTFHEAVETLFRSSEHTHFTWNLRILSVPDEDVESQLTIGRLTDGRHIVESASVATGIYTLLRDAGASRRIDSRELLSRITVKRASRIIDARQASAWIERTFEAVARTPHILARESLIASSSGTTAVVLHGTTYIVIFDDYRLQFRFATLGPRIEGASASSIPIIQAIADISKDVKAVLRRRQEPMLPGSVK
jgi:hypothetical protein